MPARILLIANILGIWAYILYQGAFKFYVEAWGTWLLSPLIFLRLIPLPVKIWVLRMNREIPILSEVVCAIPVFIFIAAVILGVWGGRKGSLPPAVAASILMTSIFVVYHSVKHLGLQLVIY